MFLDHKVRQSQVSSFWSALIPKLRLTSGWRRSSSSCSRWWRRTGSGRGWASVRCCRASSCSWRPCRIPAPPCSAHSTGWPTICCWWGRAGEKGKWRVRTGTGSEAQREGGDGEGWRLGRVKRSCQVTAAKLTPHSPDQSRQVGRRDGPAPRREEETHCWTNTDERTDARMTTRRRWGWKDGAGRYRHSACLSASKVWLTLEETRGGSQEGRRREEKRHEEFG